MYAFEQMDRDCPYTRGPDVVVYEHNATVVHIYGYEGAPRIQNPELIDSFVNEVVLA